MNSAGGVSDRQAIIGKCPAMQEVYKAIGIVASQDVTVLIRGESGTGKELVARALYQHGDRTRGTFLAVNCAAIPENLLESELFGHEKGAFTGADRTRIGKFEQCNGGTLFLDEIGDMTPVLQSKLLRILQEKQFERVGGNETITSDVRVIAATHRNLEQMVSDGEFRADLYYRLNGFTIYLPPLRERGADLDLLVEHFRRVIGSELDTPRVTIVPEVMELLRNYPWPGNIRELQNAIRQGLLKTTGKVLIPDFLPEFVRKSAAARIDSLAKQKDDLAKLIEEKVMAGTDRLYDDVIGHVEDHLVSRVLTITNGDKNAAIRKLGVNPTVLRSPAAIDLLNLTTIEKYNGNGPVIKPGMTMKQIEKQAIEQALETSKGCRKDAAEMLGISVRTMQRKIREHQLDV
jgi:two-component system nitrogen regulation response regulator GlnG